MQRNTINDRHGNVLFTVTVTDDGTRTVTLDPAVRDATGMPATVTLYTYASQINLATLLDGMMRDTGH